MGYYSVNVFGFDFEDKLIYKLFSTDANYRFINDNEEEYYNNPQLTAYVFSIQAENKKEANKILNRLIVDLLKFPANKQIVRMGADLFINAHPDEFYQKYTVISRETFAEQE